MMLSEPSLLRARTEHARVTNVELFFDLVFVFAVTQLSHNLIEHFTALGLVQTTVLFMAVWWVWIYTPICTCPWWPASSPPLWVTIWCSRIRPYLAMPRRRRC
jgi:low temperature requirement protein LtrA